MHLDHVDFAMNSFCSKYIYENINYETNSYIEKIPNYIFENLITSSSFLLLNKTPFSEEFYTLMAALNALYTRSDYESNSFDYGAIIGALKTYETLTKIKASKFMEDE